MNKYEYRTEDLRFFSSKGNYKNYNACICIRIWNDDSFFFIKNFLKGGRKQFRDYFYRQNNDDPIFFLFFFFASNTKKFV